MSMSLEKFKKGNSDQANLLKSKLTILQEHIRRTQNLPLTLFMHPQLLGHLKKQKQYIQPSNQIYFQQPKSFLLNQRPVSRFYFISLPITQQKRYCLKVEPSKTILQIFMQLDSQKKGSFFISKNKAIIIHQTDWKKVDFVIQVKKVQKLSMVKICIDTIVIDHKVKIHVLPSQRKIVQKQLKQFLKNNMNKQKINAILEKRKRKSMVFTRDTQRIKSTSVYASTMNLQTSRMFRNLSGFNQSTSIARYGTPILKQPKIQQIQQKRQMNYFQDSKQKFLKHLQKMSPQKAQQLEIQQKKYQQHKLKTLKSIANLTIALVFLNKSYKMCVQVSKAKMGKMHIRLLCKKFIKNLHLANKLRMTYRTRSKVTMDLNLSMISSFFWKEDRKRAEERIISRFKTQFFVIDINKAADLSLRYIECAKVLQRKFRLDNGFYRLRLQTITKGVKGFKFQSDKQFQELFKRYKKFCYTKSKMLKFGFTKYHKKLDELMKQLIQQRKTKNN